MELSAAAFKYMQKQLESPLAWCIDSRLLMFTTSSRCKIKRCEHKMQAEWAEGLAEQGLALPRSSQVSIKEKVMLRHVSKGRFAWCFLSQVAAIWNTPPGRRNLRNLEGKTKSLGSKGIFLMGLRVTLRITNYRGKQAMGSRKSHRDFVNGELKGKLGDLID